MGQERKKREKQRSLRLSFDTRPNARREQRKKLWCYGEWWKKASAQKLYQGHRVWNCTSVRVNIFPRIFIGSAKHNSNTILYAKSCLSSKRVEYHYSTVCQIMFVSIQCKIIISSSHCVSTRYVLLNLRRLPSVAISDNSASITREWFG